MGADGNPMRLPAVLLTLAPLLLGGDKPPIVAQASNQRLALSATVLTDREAIKQELGSDLGGYFVLVRIEITPKDGKPLAVSLDDFLLRSYKDGQKSQPFQPTQIAGRGAVVVTQTYEGGGMGSDPGGPVWGGIPGIGGRPARLPGQSSGIGNSAGVTGASAKVDDGSKQKEDPLLATLKQKVLQEKETAAPLRGLLYFSLEGKHKPKDLTLQYSGPAGKLQMQFK